MHNGVLPKILNRYDNGRFIVGFDGLSRAGKTTMVEEIKKGLRGNGKNVCVIHIDDYIVERKKRYGTGFEEWHEYYHLQWDVGYLRQHLFARLRDVLELTLPVYNSNRDEITDGTVVIPYDCIVIVEGVFLQRKEWREFFDFMVYLDCPRQTRFERESIDIRQQVEKFNTRYWKAEDYYLNTINPLLHADMVLNS